MCQLSQFMLFITLQWAQKQFVWRVHAVSRSPQSHSADGVTIDSWWRHNYPTIGTLARWEVISKSIDIEFIHSDIHGRPCRKISNLIRGVADIAVRLCNHPIALETVEHISWMWIVSQLLQWRHNGCDGVSNHKPHHWILKHLIWRRSKKTSKLRVTGL